MKKILTLILVCVLTVSCLVGCNSTSTDTSKGNAKLPVLTEVTSETVKNKALLIVDPSADNTTTENMLANFANKFNLDIQKVEYGSAWTTFEASQETTDGTSSDLAVELENYFATIEDEALLTSVYEQFNNALVKIVEEGNDDISAEMQKAQELLPQYPATDYEAYVKEVAKMYTTMLTGGKIDPLNLPQLIIIDEQEIGRLQGFSTYPEKFAYLAATTGLFDLEKTSSIDEVISKIEKAETFIAVYSSSTCHYCLDTIPVLQQVASENNIPVIEVNLASVKNPPEKLDTLLERGYISTEISGTPTICYYKNGTLNETQTGSMTLTQIKSFVTRNK